MTRARVAPATAAPLRVSARTTSRAHRRIPEDPPAEHDRRDRKGIERPPRPRSPQRWRTLPGPASSPTPRQPSSHGAHPQPPRGRPRRPPRATRSGRPSPPRWTTALCAAHGSWRTSSRAARRAQSTCPPTTAAHAATASRSGAKAVPPRITPSCTACRPSAGNPEAADKTHTPSVRARMTTPECVVAPRGGVFRPARRLSPGEPGRPRADRGCRSGRPVVGGQPASVLAGRGPRTGAALAAGVAAVAAPLGLDGGRAHGDRPYRRLCRPSGVGLGGHRAADAAPALGRCRPARRPAEASPTTFGSPPRHAVRSTTPARDAMSRPKCF